MKIYRLIAAALLCAGSWLAADACSRVTYLGDKGTVLVGRTLDWSNPIPTNIYVYPQGVAKQSNAQGPMFKWTSKYGSVLAVGYDGGVTEGMNERGLVMNGLFCKHTVYRVPDADGKLPVMSLAMLVSYFLDNFQSVEEVYQWMQANPFAISGKTFDGGKVSTLHWGITDRTGDTLIVEYVNGEMTLHRGRQYQVLTNNPTFPQMLAINAYWEGVGGQHMLPGTPSSPDRFVRASYFIHHVPTSLDYTGSLAAIESIMGVVTVPYAYHAEGAEDGSSYTQWRSVSDLIGGRYYFKQAASQGDLWIELQRLDLRPGAPILKLDMARNGAFMGAANHLLRSTPGFTPMY